MNTQTTHVPSRAIALLLGNIHLSQHIKLRHPPFGFRLKSLYYNYHIEGKPLTAFQIPRFPPIALFMFACILGGFLFSGDNSIRPRHALAGRANSVDTAGGPCRRLRLRNAPGLSPGVTRCRPRQRYLGAEEAFPPDPPPALPGGDKCSWAKGRPWKKSFW